MLLKNVVYFSLILLFLLFSQTQAEDKSIKLESFTGKVDVFDIVNLRIMDISSTLIKVRLVEFPEKEFSIWLKDAQMIDLTKYNKESVLTKNDSLVLQKDLIKKVGRKALITCKKQKKGANDRYEGYNIIDFEIIK